MSRSALLPRLVEFWVAPVDARPARRWRILFGLVLTFWFVGWIRGVDLLLPDRLASARGVDSMISLPGGRSSWVVLGWAIAGLAASALFAAGVMWRPQPLWWQPAPSRSLPMTGAPEMGVIY